MRDPTASFSANGIQHSSSNSRNVAACSVSSLSQWWMSVRLVMGSPEPEIKTDSGVDNTAGSYSLRNQITESDRSFTETSLTGEWLRKSFYCISATSRFIVLFAVLQTRLKIVFWITRVCVCVCVCARARVCRQWQPQSSRMIHTPVHSRKKIKRVSPYLLYNYGAFFYRQMGILSFKCQIKKMVRSQ
jgi:hypothetical protein